MSRLLRYEPLSVLNDINKLFEQTFPLQNNRDSSYVESAQWVPAVDIKEETSSFTLYVDLPGMDKSEITISMENNVLTLQGDRKNGKKLLALFLGTLGFHFVPNSIEDAKKDTAVKYSIIPSSLMSHQNNALPVGS